MLWELFQSFLWTLFKNIQLNFYAASNNWLVIFQLLSEIWNASVYVMDSLYWNPKHWFWEYLVGNNNMRRRRMGEMQTKFHQKTYICLLLLVFNRWQSDFFFHLRCQIFILFCFHFSKNSIGYSILYMFKADSPDCNSYITVHM